MGRLKKLITGSGKTRSFAFDISVESAVVAGAIWMFWFARSYPWQNQTLAMLWMLASAVVGLLGLIMVLFLVVTICWGVADLKAAAAGTTASVNPGRSHYFRAMPKLADGVSIRATSEHLMICRDGVPTEVPRAWDDGFHIEGDEIVVGEIRADISGVDHDTLRQELLDAGWGGPREEPKGNVNQLAPADDEGAWAQPPGQPTHEDEQTSFPSYDSLLRKDDRVDVRSPRFWLMAEVPWALLLWIGGIVLTAAYGFGLLRDHSSVIASIALVVAVLIGPFFVLTLDQFPWSRHSESIQAYELSISPTEFRAKRGDGVSRVWASGHEMSWDSATHTLSADDGKAVMLPRLQPEDFVETAVERGWTVIVDGTAHALLSSES